MVGSVMPVVASVVVALALFAPAVAEPSSSPSFAIGLPVGLFDAMIAAEQSAILAEISALVQVPSSCCYDDVGADNVHLCLQSIAVDDYGFDASFEGSTGVLEVEFTGSAQYSSSYRLCLHVGGCSELFGCSGSAAVEIAASGSMALELSASGTSLGLEVSDVSLGLSLPKDTFCSKIEGEVNKQLPAIAKAVSATATAQTNALLAKYLALLPSSHAFDAVLGLDWLYNASISTFAAPGLVVGGTLEPVALERGNSVGPFAPDGSGIDLGLVEALMGNESFVVVALTDSVAANAAWVLWDSSALSNLTFNATVLSQQAQAVVTVTAPPVVAFAPAGLAGDVLVSANASVTISVDGHVLASPDFALELLVNASTNASEGALDVTVSLARLVVTNVPSVLLRDAIAAAVAKELEALNAKLAESPPVLPQPAHTARLDYEGLVFAPGVAALQLTVSFESEPLESPAAPAAPLACPAIGGAHLDSCSVC